jgi:hypothetical protein
MSRTNSNRRKPALVAVLAILLACLGLTACGGSSKSSSTTNTSTSASTTGRGTGGPNAGRFAALRECLQKNGVTLPQQTTGQRRPGGAGRGLGGLLGGGAQLPKGVTRAQMQSAMSKCGGVGFGAGARPNNPAFKASLTKFAICMRQNGVNLPAPNTSGGPVFNTKGLNTTSARFRGAQAKCSSILRGSFGGRGGRPGAPGASGANGAPGANGA